MAIFKPSRSLADFAAASAAVIRAALDRLGICVGWALALIDEGLALAAVFTAVFRARGFGFVQGLM